MVRSDLDSAKQEFTVFPQKEFLSVLDIIKKEFDVVDGAISTTEVKNEMDVPWIMNNTEDFILPPIPLSALCQKQVVFHPPKKIKFRDTGRPEKYAWDEYNHDVFEHATDVIKVYVKRGYVPEDLTFFKESGTHDWVGKSHRKQLVIKREASISLYNKGTSFSYALPYGFSCEIPTGREVREIVESVMTIMGGSEYKK